MERSPLQPEQGPPIDEVLERVVLGAILLESNALTKVIDILLPEVFYYEPNRTIYSAILAMREKALPIDLVLVYSNLLESGEAAKIPKVAHYLSELTSSCAGSANLEYHSYLLVEHFIRRETEKLGQHLQAKSQRNADDCFEAIQFAQNRLRALSERNTRTPSSVLSEGFTDALDGVLAKVKGDVVLTGLTSGFPSLDKLTAGWQSGNLIIIAGRPSMGKTAFALALARNLAVPLSVPILFFSLEMTKKELQARLIISESGYDMSRAGLSGQADAAMIMERTGKLYAAPIVINEESNITIVELSAEARRVIKQSGVKAIFVDYLQLISSLSSKNSNREQEIAAMSRGLKILAKELQVPIFALAQLSRETEKRVGDKRPRLSDLRESGAIENDADLVVFLHRPGYYGQKETEDGISTDGLCEVIIGKHRNGPIGTVNLNFTLATGKFTDSYDYKAPSPQTKADF